MIAMNLEGKLEVIKKAMEMGASVNVNFHNCLDIEEAEDNMNTLSPLMNEDYTHHERDGVYWFECSYYDELEVAAFYEKQTTKWAVIQIKDGTVEAATERTTLFSDYDGAKHYYNILLEDDETGKVFITEVLITNSKE